jgi:hypothetical protein
VLQRLDVLIDVRKSNAEIIEGAERNRQEMTEYDCFGAFGPQAFDRTLSKTPFWCPGNISCGCDFVQNLAKKTLDRSFECKT